MDSVGNNIFSIESHSPNAAYTFSKELSSLIYEKSIQINDIIILCIGTDRSTGDCLGPLVGEKLQKIPSLRSFNIIGNLQNPIHAKNIEQKTKELINTYDNPFILAIDASLGKVDNIGNINLVAGSIIPGSGVNKNLKPIGDISITGIVNIYGFMEYIILQNTRLSLVMHMADIISLSLYMTLIDLKHKTLIKEGIRN